MGSFNGSKEEFRRYIGPRLRNLVQQISRPYRDSVRVCEHCNTTGSLDSAHVKGRDRNDIIDLVLSEYVTDVGVEVDLKAFEDKFKAEHYPLDKSFLILCRPCHRVYDGRNQPQNARHARSDRTRVEASDGVFQRDVLPIALEPSDPDVFRNDLLISRRAIINIHYENGSREERVWNAQRFSARSNVIGNLRSRPEFRHGEWQRNGIKKLVVKVTR